MSQQIYNRQIEVEGISIFYREAGNPQLPSLLLLHGFPTSSIMFKNLMIVLSGKYHLIAPDYPGFGFSDFPPAGQFEYSFKNIASVIGKFTDAIALKSFSIYLHDYGCLIGLRVCLDYPEKIERLIIQNGHAYTEGLGPQWHEMIAYWNNPTEEKKKQLYGFLSKEGTEWQYRAGLPEEMQSKVSPESWILDWERMERPGNLDMQYELNCTYNSNFDMFPLFQEYFRTHHPPAIIIWGRYDVFYDLKEAYCYQKDLPDASIHILNGGHMALETNFEEVCELVNHFMSS
ncbi:alpha/beta hydrolase [Niabella yanshanensis]|uniref:Alpha/beta hydrolase n=1 Tax=Niabella yanshanensis TaxID=577386 RepID=A0ABZ0W5J6_9BACT|nr:alpha/beta hydrolase [Niabella yanshanensis]WQD38199.1 alpha/beta hydrolase [Niabella yanshanensis]